MNHGRFFNDNFQRTPFFFKAWFTFIAVAIVAVFVTMGAAAYSAYQAGPEGFGRAVGTFLRGIEEGQK